MLMSRRYSSQRALLSGRTAAVLELCKLFALATLLAPAAHAANEKTGKEVVDTACIACHGTGVNGAPKIGDRAAWIPRMKQGIDAVVRSAINGHGGMPARGGMANLTDAEMRSAVVYMFNAGTVPEKSSATATGGED